MIADFLNKNHHFLLPFDMVFSYPHTEGYDPISVIEKFWQNYDVNDSRDHLVCLCLKAFGLKIDDKVKDISEKALNDYSLELMHLLVAYYLCYIHNIELSGLEIPQLMKGKISEEDMKIRQINYALFGSKKPINQQ